MYFLKNENSLRKWKNFASQLLNIGNWNAALVRVFSSLKSANTNKDFLFK